MYMRLVWILQNKCVEVSWEVGQMVITREIIRRMRRMRRIAKLQLLMQRLGTVPQQERVERLIHELWHRHQAEVPVTGIPLQASKPWLGSTRNVPCLQCGH